MKQFLYKYNFNFKTEGILFFLSLSFLFFQIYMVYPFLFLASQLRNQMQPVKQTNKDNIYINNITRCIHHMLHKF